MLKRSLGRTIILLGSVATAPAPQPLPSIFGQQLGAAISYPDCKYEVSEFGEHARLYYAAQPVPCIKQVAGSPFFVQFPAAARPELMSLDAMYFEVIDGKVEGITTAVIGHNFAQSVIDQLSAKFGKPTLVTPKKVVLEGIAVTEIFARWQRPGFSVEYDSILDDLEHGDLAVRTDKGTAAIAAKDAAEAAKKVGL